MIMFIKPVILILSSLSLLVFAAEANIFDFDDDRHIKDPDDKDATNSPRMPSTLSSAAPSYSPSKEPSLEATNDDDTGTIEILGLGSLSWGFIGVGIILFSTLLLFKRYRYSSSRKDAKGISRGDTRIVDDDSDEDYI